MSRLQVSTQPALTDVALGEPAVAPAPPSRLHAIDLVRGVVMVVMTLDHTRDLLTRQTFDATDLSKTTAALFLTRWVTHFCAPVFVFLAGTGAFLAGTQKLPRQLAWFLATRGLWLVALEFTLVQGGWSFDPFQTIFIGQVIWAIGWSMVLLAGLIQLPTWAVGLLGALLVAGHNAFDGVTFDGFPGVLWKVFKSGGFLRAGPDYGLVAAYPILPWLGIMLLGYACGEIWLQPARRRRLTGLGLGTIALFIALRASNLYGDPRPWSVQAEPLFTVLSFVNCTKYPPSLLYALMTLGPALVLLAWCDRKPGHLGRVLVTFGRVPLFYYLLHVPLIHVLAIGLAYARYGGARFLFKHILLNAQALPEDYGYSLPVVYALWLLVVALLYLPCRWFAELKRRRRNAWLSYL